MVLSWIMTALTAAWWLLRVARWVKGSIIGPVPPKPFDMSIKSWRDMGWDVGIVF